MKKAILLLVFLMGNILAFATIPNNFQAYSQQQDQLHAAYASFKSVDYSIYYAEKKWKNLNNALTEINDLNTDVIDNILKYVNKDNYLSKDKADNFNARLVMRETLKSDLQSAQAVEAVLGYAPSTWNKLCKNAERLHDFDKSFIEELYKTKKEKEDSLLEKTKETYKTLTTPEVSNSQKEGGFNWLWMIAGALGVLGLQRFFSQNEDNPEKSK